MYDRCLAKIQALLVTAGTFLAFAPMILLGYGGLPRRYGVYPEEFVAFQQVASVGAFVIGAGVVVVQGPASAPSSRTPTSGTAKRPTSSPASGSGSKTDSNAVRSEE